MTLGVNRVRYQADAPFDVPSLISQRQTVAAVEQFRCCPKATSPKEGGLRRLLTLRFGDAQPVFFYNPEKLQPVDKRLTFASIRRIESQFFNSPNYCFLSPLNLLTQVLRIKFTNCLSERFLPLRIFQIHCVPSRLSP